MVTLLPAPCLASTFDEEPHEPFWDTYTELGRPWLRLGGSTRYATSAEVAAEAFTSSAWAVVVSGASFADALSASAVAGAHEAPIVLTEADRLTQEARSTLASLGVRDVVVVGGEAAVSPAVTSSLEAAGIRTTRIWGEDRQATSVAALDAVPAAEVAFVASGDVFADALSAGPWAWARHAPILLCGGGGVLGEEALRALATHEDVRRVVILGGTAAVSEQVEAQLAGLGRTLEVERLAGTDRYATSAEVARWECANGFGWSCPVVASGRGFADALSGAPLAGRYRSPLLLAGGTDGPHAQVLAETAGAFVGGTLLGGTSAISWGAVCALEDPEAVSPLVSLVVLSPNHSGPRLEAVSAITPHYMDEQWSALTCGRSFADPSRQASSNYGIGLDGRVALYVEESHRSWASSSADNDNRAITIENASLPDSSLTPATWESLVELCADICRRNGLGPITYTGEPTGTLTKHLWFARDPVTECPGPWLSERFGELADAVNERLGYAPSAPASASSAARR